MTVPRLAQQARLISVAYKAGAQLLRSLSASKVYSALQADSEGAALVAQLREDVALLGKAPGVRIGVARRLQGASSRRRTGAARLFEACREVRQRVKVRYRGPRHADLRRAFGEGYAASAEKPETALHLADLVLAAAARYPAELRGAGVRSQTLPRIARLAAELRATGPERGTLRARCASPRSRTPVPTRRPWARGPGHGACAAGPLTPSPRLEVPMGDLAFTELSLAGEDDLVLDLALSDRAALAAQLQDAPGLPATLARWLRAAPRAAVRLSLPGLRDNALNELLTAIFSDPEPAEDLQALEAGLSQARPHVLPALLRTGERFWLRWLRVPRSEAVAVLAAAALYVLGVPEEAQLGLVRDHLMAAFRALAPHGSASPAVWAAARVLLFFTPEERSRLRDLGLPASVFSPADLEVLLTATAAQDVEAIVAKLWAQGAPS